MKRIEKLAEELRLIFAKLYKTDQQIEELLKNARSKNLIVRSSSARQLEKTLALQSRLCASIKTLTREYKEIMTNMSKNKPAL